MWPRFIKPRRYGSGKALFRQAKARRLGPWKNDSQWGAGKGEWTTVELEKDALPGALCWDEYPIDNIPEDAPRISAKWALLCLVLSVPPFDTV